MIAGKTFNAGYENHTVAELGRMVHSTVLREMPHLAPIEVTTSPTNDLRSYHISSEKIARELGWKPKRTIEDTVVDLCRAFRDGMLPNALTDTKYFNVRTIQAAPLTCALRSTNGRHCHWWISSSSSFWPSRYSLCCT